jgi:hypothetical protein
MTHIKNIQKICVICGYSSPRIDIREKTAFGHFGGHDRELPAVSAAGGLPGGNRGDETPGVSGLELLGKAGGGVW